MLILFITSCQSKDNSEPKHKISSLLDSTDTKSIISTKENTDVTSYDRKKTIDSMVQATLKSALFDTIGLSDAPITILKKWFTQEDYSNYKNIALTYKNVSNKRITAIRFRWYGETAFGDPADMGTTLQEGFGGGFTDQTLGPDKARTSEWSILSRNGKKIILAWPTEIMFEDGTKWEIGKK